MANFSERRAKMLWVITLTLLCLYLAQNFVLHPTLAKLRNARGKLLIAQQDLTQLQELWQRRDEAEAAYGALRQRFDAAPSREREIIQMLLTIEKAAKEARVEIMENNHLKDQNFEYYGLHTVRFRGTGKIEAVYGLLIRLQDPAISMKVGRMHLQMKGALVEVELEATKVTVGAGT